MATATGGYAAPAFPGPVPPLSEVVPVGRARPYPRSRLPLHRRLLTDRTLLVRWSAALVLAGTAGALTHRVVAAAEEAQHQWGRTTTVLVTTRPLAAGDPLTRAYRVERWPVALRPPAALTDVTPGDRAAVGLDAGVPLTAAGSRAHRHVQDRRLLSIDLGPDHLAVEPGDHVDVWATVDPSLGTGRVRTELVVADAVVAQNRPRSVVVAVTDRDAGPLAEAVALATVTLVAHG